VTGEIKRDSSMKYLNEILWNCFYSCTAHRDAVKVFYLL